MPSGTRFLTGCAHATRAATAPVRRGRLAAAAATTGVGRRMGPAAPFADAPPPPFTTFVTAAPLPAPPAGDSAADGSPLVHLTPADAAPRCDSKGEVLLRGFPQGGLVRLFWAHWRGLRSQDLPWPTKVGFTAPEHSGSYCQIAPRNPRGA